MPTDPGTLRPPNGSVAGGGGVDDTIPGALEAPEPAFGFRAGGAVTGDGVDTEDDPLEPDDALDDEDDDGLDAGPTGEVPIAELPLPEFFAELLVPADDPASLEP